MFYCDFGDCCEGFKKKWKLIEHVAKHTGEKPFACSHAGCIKAFTRQPHLQRHLKSHGNLKDFLCDEVGCGGAFSSRDNLKKHTLRVHQGRQFKCDYDGCGKTFHKHQHLTVHQYVHTNIKPFKCEHEGCEARFLIPSKLKAHLKIHQGYTCSKDDCKAWFSKWSELTAHMATHTSDFPCEKCDKVYNTKHKLRNHMKVHDEEREVFVCPREDCERQFLKMESLRLHISKFHDGERPFSCDHLGCSKTFSYKKSLVHHQVVHEPGYQKSAAKPRKRRTLASRLSGHPDLAEHDFMGSPPPDNVTFDPGKLNDTEEEEGHPSADKSSLTSVHPNSKQTNVDNQRSVKVSPPQTEQTDCGALVSMEVSSPTTEMNDADNILTSAQTNGGTQSCRETSNNMTASTSKLDEWRVADAQEEIDLNDSAERMLLAMQSADICELYPPKQGPLDFREHFHLKDTQEQSQG